MNHPAPQRFDPTHYASVLDAQVTALLQRVNDHSTARCQQLQDETQQQVRDILRDARKQARQNMHQTAARERVRMEQSRRQTQAAVALSQREHTARHMQQVLDAMWRSLPEVMQARWTDPKQRCAWIQAAVSEADRVLGGRDWNIEHGADVTPDECAQWLQHRVRHPGQPGPSNVVWRLDAGISAGIRIRAANACLDATIAGLLSNRADVEAAFLAEHASLAGTQRADGR